MIQALITRGRREAAEVLVPIAFPRRNLEPRSDPSETEIAAIYRRDHFHCRYSYADHEAPIGDLPGEVPLSPTGWGVRR